MTNNLSITKNETVISESVVAKRTSSGLYRVKFGFSRWGEAFRVAVSAILANRLRSSLTIIGVVIGVAVVTFVAALLEGAQTYIKQTASELGPGIARIDKASFQDFLGDAQSFAEALSKRPDITIEDIEGLRQRIGDRMEVGAQIDAALPAQRGNNSLQGIAVQGVTANIAALSTIKIARGRELTDFDDENRRSVCVIGSDVDEFLFPDRESLGQFIKLGSAEYEVIGVAVPRGSSFGASQDGFVQIPLGTFAKVFGARSRSISMLVKPKPGVEVPNEQVEEIARFGMRSQRRLSYGDSDNFSIITAKSVEAVTSLLTRIVGSVLYPLTAIALGVGGIVVMNMMLASVTERTREIGIRLAIGARRKDILAQFLLESSLLTLAGGLVGMMISAGLVWISAKLSGFPIAVPLWALFAAILISCAVGVIFGVFPARRASRLSPIEALRKE
ncbi:MAG TPA: ABC transporter permease [Blastocatellia bacterium]|nr:ABC transporter permease [Blastocatellia bacterium]